MLLNATSYARAGLIGNPSDGYFGKTLTAIGCTTLKPVIGRGQWRPATV